MVFFSSDWARLTLVAESLLLCLQVRAGNIGCYKREPVSLFVGSFFYLPSALLTPFSASVLAAALCSGLGWRNVGFPHGPYCLPDGLSRQSLPRGCCGKYSGITFKADQLRLCLEHLLIWGCSRCVLIIRLESFHPSPPHLPSPTALPCLLSYAGTRSLLIDNQILV